MLRALFQKEGEEKNERNLFPLGRRSDAFFFLFPSIYEAAESPSAGWHVQKKMKK